MPYQNVRESLRLARLLQEGGDMALIAKKAQDADNFEAFQLALEVEDPEFIRKTSERYTGLEGLKTYWNDQHGIKTESRGPFYALRTQEGQLVTFTEHREMAHVLAETNGWKVTKTINRVKLVVEMRGLYSDKANRVFEIGARVVDLSSGYGLGRARVGRVEKFDRRFPESALVRWDDSPAQIVRENAQTIAVVTDVLEGRAGTDTLRTKLEGGLPPYKAQSFALFASRGGPDTVMEGSSPLAILKALHEEEIPISPEGCNDVVNCPQCGEESQRGEATQGEADGKEVFRCTHCGGEWVQKIQEATLVEGAVQCPACGSEHERQEVLLGKMGNRDHYRCRSCGMTFSGKAKGRPVDRIPQKARMKESIDPTEPGISSASLDIHRAIASTIEELQAIDDYDQRAAATPDSKLKDALLHSRDEEISHAVTFLEWLRRRVPAVDEKMKKGLFQPGEMKAEGTALLQKILREAVGDQFADRAPMNGWNAGFGGVAPNEKGIHRVWSKNRDGETSVKDQIHMGDVISASPEEALAKITKKRGAPGKGRVYMAQEIPVGSVMKNNIVEAWDADGVKRLADFGYAVAESHGPRHVAITKSQGNRVKVRIIGGVKVEPFTGTPEDAAAHLNKHLGSAKESIEDTLPTIESLQSLFRVEEKIARTIRELMQSCSVSQGVHEVLEAIDGLIGGLGVEALQMGEGYTASPRWRDTVCLYVNRGGLHETTICYDTRTGKFESGSPRDFAEWVQTHQNDYK